MQFFFHLWSMSCSCCPVQLLIMVNWHSSKWCFTCINWLFVTHQVTYVWFFFCPLPSSMFFVCSFLCISSSNTFTYSTVLTRYPNFDCLLYIKADTENDMNLRLLIIFVILFPLVLCRRRNIISSAKESVLDPSLQCIDSVICEWGFYCTIISCAF